MQLNDKIRGRWLNWAGSWATRFPEIFAAIVEIGRIHLRKETCKTSRIYHHEKVGSRLKFEGAKSGFQVYFSRWLQIRWVFGGLLTPPPFGPSKTLKIPGFFEKIPRFFVFIISFSASLDPHILLAESQEHLVTCPLCLRAFTTKKMCILLGFYIELIHKQFCFLRLSQLEILWVETNYSD